MTNVEPKAAWPLAGVALIVALFAAAYYRTFAMLVTYWAQNDMYWYGFAVPVLAGVLAWTRRDQWRGLRPSSSLVLGSGVLVGGLLMLLAGRVSATNLVEELSLVASVSGVVLLLFGTRAFRVVAFPIAYLLAMIPFWDLLTVGFHRYFQLYSAAISVDLVRLAGVPVLRDGFLIRLPNVTLEVAQACSGVNYLIAIFCVGIPMAYLFVRGWPKRLAIVGASALIALLGNGLRVAVVSMFAYYGIHGANGDIHGPFALFRSLLISGVGFVALFWLIFRFGDRDALAARRAAANPPGPLGSLRPHGTGTLVAGALLGAVLAFGAWHRVAAVPPAVDLQDFTSRIGDWRATERVTFESDLDPLEFDERLSRSYVGPDGTEASVFVGYFSRQKQGRELGGYAIRTALEKQGRSTSTAPGRTGRLNDFIAEIGGRTFHVSYWYVLDGRLVADDYRAKLLTAWSALVHGRTNGGVVEVKTQVPPHTSLAEARRRDRSLVDGTILHVLAHLGRAA